MKYVFSIIVLLNINLMLGQTAGNNQFTIHIESGNGENLKSCEGYFFATELTNEKTSYSAILASKTVINNTGNIELFFNPKTGEKPNRENSQVITVPIKLSETIYDSNCDLVIIPLYLIIRSLDNKRLIYDQVLLNDEALLEFNPNIKENEFTKLKKIWDWEINEALKKRI